MTKHAIRKEVPQERKVSSSKSRKVVFGFSELREFSYVDAKNDQVFFIQFIERLRKYSQLDWNTLYSSQRHGFGTETIRVDSLKQSAQQLVSSEMEKLVVLRATGNNHVFLGYRDGDVFQIMFIEYNFGDVYDHS